MKEHKHVSSNSLFTEFDSSLFKSGKHFKLYEKLGSHIIEVEGTKGTHFAVWAPNASKVQLIGDFNSWNGDGYELYPRWDGSGVWEGFVPELAQGTVYKYKIHSNNYGQVLEKGDPFAMHWEVPPKTASVVWQNNYQWKDAQWMQARKEKNALNQPFSVYEVHLGSWKRKENGESLSYQELAVDLVNYVKDMGYTHVEFLPLMEHPFFGSWGYQGTGYFAPTSRYGTPDDFFAMMDAFHEAEIGVIMDWVPSHFPNDDHGIYNFDGTHLFEHADPRQGYHPDWSSYIFNYGRNEVRSFLISSAGFWLDVGHADGLRVDAVASMLYLDYSRKEGEWIPNQYGGRENLEAISLLKELNEYVYSEFEGIQTIAEESTAWPAVSRPTYVGGLGFGMKWMMGWMHDTLEYFKKDPFHRQYHQNNITFSLNYAFTENFMLPLSHDEVVHGKGPLIDRMPGDEWQRFANLRLLYGYMYTHPGTKLVFMGGEIGQTSEWKHDYSLDWHLLKHAPHQGVQQLTKALNKLYQSEPGLYQNGFTAEGFEWIELNDYQNSVLSFIRKGENEADNLTVICNFTPVVREHYRIGINGGTWQEIFNSDAKEFWGSGVANEGKIQSQAQPHHGRPNSLELTLPPLSVIIFKQVPEAKTAKKSAAKPKAKK
ncbi:glycogen-branching enzyme [Roseivirga spongicola]|uniref:1,4-alpha-glucan branching enzyme GlgB n=1 Tax=Roseivirga spongicola TaxID=333140 RepID=A0A150WZT4_9BACT|nr:1,4-alpha-glucan branching protein GlgB [Roseivirga spongicola]KYG71926.1 glycogen-branching enzyme [Roseivirga spongicola]